jgi:hypothetical protein
MPQSGNVSVTVTAKVVVIKVCGADDIDLAN